MNKKQYMKEYYIKNKKRLLKASKEYYQNNKEGIKKRCAKYMKDNPVKVRVWQKRKMTKMRKAWKKYFDSRFPNPSCQVCGKKLSFFHEDPRKTVIWDHRHGEGRVIKYQPARFFKRYPMNEKNIEIFNNEDFGMLCFNCNRRIPSIIDIRLKMTEYILDGLESL